MSNMSIPDKIAYGATSAFYITPVGSFATGLVRTVTAIVHLVMLAIVKNQIENIKTQQKASEDVIDKAFKLISDPVGDALKAVETMQKGWTDQLKRGLTEVFCPIIAPALWVHQDLIKEPSKIDKGISFFKKLESDTKDEDYIVSKNIFGNHDVQNLLAMGEAFEKEYV